MARMRIKLDVYVRVEVEDEQPSDEALNALAIAMESKVRGRLYELPSVRGGVTDPTTLVLYDRYRLEGGG